MRYASWLDVPIGECFDSILFDDGDSHSACRIVSTTSAVIIIKDLDTSLVYYIPSHTIPNTTFFTKNEKKH